MDLAFESRDEIDDLTKRRFNELSTNQHLIKLSSVLVIINNY